MTDWSRPVPRAEGAGRAGLSGLRARREKVYRDLKELYDVARAEATDKDAQLQRALRDVALLRSELRLLGGLLLALLFLVDAVQPLEALEAELP